MNRKGPATPTLPPSSGLLPDGHPEHFDLRHEKIEGFTLVGGGAGFLAGLGGVLSLYASTLDRLTWTSCDHDTPFGVRTAVGKGRALAVTGGRDGLVGFSRH